MKQRCVLNLFTKVSNITAQSRMKQLCVLNLINNVSNMTCTELHEAALCTELDYQRLQHNVHRVA
jgi:hypothetical protein